MCITSLQFFLKTKRIQLTFFSNEIIKELKYCLSQGTVLKNAVNSAVKLILIKYYVNIIF